MQLQQVVERLRLAADTGDRRMALPLPIEKYAAGEMGIVPVCRAAGEMSGRALGCDAKDDFITRISAEQSAEPPDGNRLPTPQRKIYRLTLRYNGSIDGHAGSTRSPEAPAKTSGG
jgi:hypothetical protein